MDLMGHSEPSFKRLTSPSYGQPSHVGNAFLESLGKPHVESFNFMLDDGLKLAIHDLERVSFEIPQNNCQVSLWIIDGRIEPPSLPPGVSGVLDYRIWPTESRQRGASYKGRMVVRVGYSVNGVTQPCLEKDLGRVPVMLRSKACHLHGLSPAQLVKHGEQETEWGGYFVIGGHERIIRMLLTTRRNYPVALQRPSWKNRGRHFSDLGIQIDCCKPDMTTVKNVLHFVNTGTAKFMFNIGKELFFVPVIMVLKCLSSRSDAEVYRCLMQGVAEDDYYYQSCLRNMFSEPQEEGLFSPDQIRAYIGGNFRERLRYMLPDSLTNEEVCDYLVRRSILIHLVQPEDKFQLLVFMVKKLFALVQDKCVVEGVDAIMMQEVVLGGHLYLQLIKEKLQAWLDSLKFSILKRFSVTSKSGSASSSTDLTPSVMTWCMNKTLHLEKMFENFIATGNLPTKSGLGLMQDKGITIMAENINRMRYMSHFRAVHRGSFFQEMRTTEVRALLPDAWGFVCPVHTPDGAPCGLLNHLALPVQVVSHPADVSRLVPILVGLGMEPVETFAPSSQQHSTTFVDVMLDGRIVGWVNRKRVAQLVDKLRLLKIDDQEVRVPQLLEVVLIPQKSNSCPGQFSGLFLFSGAARMMRPVLNLAMNKIEYIGTLEQVYMEIALTKEESYAGVTSHMELSETAFMSNLAQTIPLPDFNQSPRNMYQCQMGKQTMATPTHTWHSNSETKIYRLQTPMSPFFRPYHYDRIALDDYPMGTNAIVAVISYTGYDMEDAMIINKSSYERGFAAGSIYKAKFVDLVEEVVGKRAGADRASVNVVFERDPTKAALAQFLDQDGLPYIGTRLTDGDPFYCYRNEEEGVYKVKQYDGKEMVFVDSVKLCGDDLGTAGKNRACICVRVPRNPSVGDKFASRAGQKGICSRKWECEDLPWTESGLMPDIVFNPHGFPSRMTIAMMIECMAGKSGAINGVCHDATPFRFSENDDAIDYFGRQLEVAGYNYYGTETMYSGTKGVEVKADIFFGIIHYQRLRHMVSDKYQVRSQGPVDQVTRQPIKGRRRGGGVRFGEMERDCLLSHGSSFLLQDRLLHGSDKTVVNVCTKCGSLLSPRMVLSARANAFSRFRDNSAMCVVCSANTIRSIQVPFIFLHLISQLASVNIKVRLAMEHY